jgi:inhibitor of KinA
MKPRLVPQGDRAILIQLGDEIDLDVNHRVHALDARLQLKPPAGVIETVPAYATILVHYDPLTLSTAQVTAWLKEGMEMAYEGQMLKPRRIEVPVRYGGEGGPDLEAVAAYHKMSTDEVVRLHTSREYTVFMMGFTPGFPYMGTLDGKIAMPRLKTPRTRVAAGSVGIAEAQTGIYPIESPGGWQILGRTSLKLFDPEAAQPFLFAPGDRVQFVAEGGNA